MAKDILKEAIADAKAVREVALANAKAALEEAFTPRLQSMLSAKLSEELNEEEDLDETYMEDEKEDVKETYMEDEADEDMKEAYMEDEADEDMKEDLDEEIDLEEILSELELEEGEAEDTVDEAKKDDDDKMEEAKKDDDKDDVKEAKDEDKDDMKEAKDKDDDKVEEAKDDKEDLDEMGRPVYKAEDANYAGYSADRIHEDKEFNLDALLEEINNLDETYMEDEKEEKNEAYMEDEKEEKNEVVGVAAGIAGIIAAAGGLSALEMAADDPEFKAKYPKVANALEKMQALGKAAADTKRMEEEAKDKELDETKAALEAVRTELNEVNLLNSKLLYVNRIFKANNLDDSQKLRVVETLDKADSTKEAKLIYETIKDTFNVAKSKKVSKNKTRTIKESLGMASKAAGISTAPKKEVISESNNMVSRFQKLANIKINE